MNFEDVKKYRWFYTSSGKLVYGGKSAEQNEEVVKALMKDKNKVVMHTAEPGSPFAVIDAEMKNTSDEDIIETAIFCGCFSRAWRTGKRKAMVHAFESRQITKQEGMKTGTFGVKGYIGKFSVELELVLAKQKGVLRAVPAKSVKSAEILMKARPGKIDKEKAAEEISKKLKVSKEEVIQALPTGGIETA